METPICDFVRAYAAKDPLRLHMPGHKGKPLLGPEPWDITEVDGADVLSSAEGIIRQSEENAARLWQTAKTFYSTEGSSLAIRAMLYLTALYARCRGEEPVILAGRNAHKTFLTAAALLDLPIRWLMPETNQSLTACRLSPETVDRALTASPAAAVYLTSPDYLGNLTDVAGISAVCKKHGALLLVDNAHGAYLHFLPVSRHPMALGADLCCDSAHKTLPVLTPGAYLHVSPAAPPLFAEQGENALSLFATTSPSYLTLQSLDAANRYLSDGYREKLAAFCPRAEEVKHRLKAQGYGIAGDEPLKITLAPKGYGYTGTELAALLRQNGAECEAADPDHLVLMLSPEDGGALRRLETLLTRVPRRAPRTETPPPPPEPEPVCSPRQALFSPAKTLPAEDCLGRVCAAPSVSCPPAVPLALCGERITAPVLRLFAYYGVKTCRVIDGEEIAP